MKKRKSFWLLEWQPDKSKLPIYFGGGDPAKGTLKKSTLNWKDGKRYNSAVEAIQDRDTLHLMIPAARDFLSQLNPIEHMEL